MQTKDEALDYFIIFQQWIESLGHNIKNIILRTDNDTNYIKGKFNEYCKNNGITQQTTAPYVHTNLAVGERIWYTLMDMTRASLLTTKLDRKYWPLAFAHATYIYNRRPHTGINMKTPYEALFETKPDLSKIRVFGCSAYPHIDPVGRRKLDDRASNGIYVGHDDNSPAYKILYPDTGKVKFRGKCTFIENINSYSQIITHNLPEEYDTTLSDDEYTKLPNDFYENDKTTDYVRGVTKITDHRVHYDTEDKETYGIVKIHTKNKPNGYWTYLSTLLDGESDREHFKILDKYVANKIGRGQENIFYPIFSKVNVIDSGKKYAAYIVSTDSNNKNAAYQVCYEDRIPSDNGEIIRREDIPKVKVEFNVGAIAKSDNLATYVDPYTYAQSQSYPDAVEWERATLDETKSMIDFGVMEPIYREEIPEDKNITGTRFVFKLKRKHDGSIDKYKVRLVAQGFTQVHGEDYEDTYAPVSQILSIRLLLTLPCRGFFRHLVHLASSALILQIERH
jgi:hypothetical protein